MDTRERILATSFQLFAAQGVKRITMDDIANELGMSKRTIYEHFSDKEEILISALEYLEECDKSVINDISQKSANLLEALILGVINVVENYRLIRNIFYLDIKKYYPKVFALIQERNQKIREKTHQFLVKGQNDFLIRSDIDPELISSMIAEHIEFGMFHSDSLYKDLTRRKAMFETSIIIFIRGLATLDGLKIIDSIYQGYKNKKNI